MLGSVPGSLIIGDDGLAGTSDLFGREYAYAFVQTDCQSPITDDWEACGVDNGLSST